MGNQAEWRVLDLPAGVQVHHLADSSPGYVVIGGTRQGTAFAAEVPADPGVGELVVIPVTEQASAAGPVRSVEVSDAGVLGVCGATTLWGRRRSPDGAYTSQGWEEYVATPTHVYYLPVDESGAEAVWVWVTSADGTLQATVAYPTADGRHEVRPLDVETFQLMERDQQLVTAAPLAELHVAAFAGRVTVAGPITEPADPSVLTSWWASSAQLDPQQYRYEPPWHYNEFADPPAQLLDGISWDGMSFYAGLTHNGTVALWDAEGELRESTELRPDTENPTGPVALLAELDGWGDFGEEDGPGGLAAFAVTTADGNVLSCRGLTFPMPAGRLQAAVVNRGFDQLRCFALIDDVVHVLAFDYPNP